VRSSTGMRGLVTIRVIMVDAKLLTDTRSRSVGQQTAAGQRGQTQTVCQFVRVMHNAKLASKLTLQVPC
jgi:hypothetical protein